MAYIIRDIGVLPKVNQKPQILSCMNKSQEQIKNKIYDADDIQRRINEAAKVRERLDSEIKKRYEDIKHINYLG